MKKEGPWKTESVQEAAGAATAEWERSAPRCGRSLFQEREDSVSKPLETTCSRGARRSSEGLGLPCGLAWHL